MTTSVKEVIAAAIPEALRSVDGGAAIYAKGGEIVIDGCFNMHSAATAILAALDAAGFVVVPREPTEAMVDAAWLAPPISVEKVYRAMIAAQESKP